MNFLEGTNYNFSCVPVGEPADVGDVYHFVEAVTLNPMPRLVSCKQQIRVPFNVSSLESQFCGMISVMRDLESGSIGLQAVSGDCTVRIGQSMPEGNSESYLVRLSKGSYRFMKDLNSIGCVEAGEGLYANCTADMNLGELKPKDQGYDVGKETIVDKTTASGSADSWGKPVSFKFESNLKSIFMIIGIVVGVIVVVIIVLVCCWKFGCKKNSGSGSGGQMTLVSSLPPQ
jgi:hypothetical protein